MTTDMQSRILTRLRPGLPNRKSLRRSHPDGGSTLEIIPLEIVQEIAEYLLPEAKAALALASRTMLYRFGTEALKLGLPSRYNLLLLLSKDGIWLQDILCPFCYVFHAPFPIPAWPSGPHTNTRACQTEKADGKRKPWEQAISSPWLPAHVTFNTVAAVMRCHRHNSTAYMPETLASSDKFEIGDCKVHCYHDFRIVNGHLLLKTEKLVLPCKGKAKTTNAFSQVQAILQIPQNEAWKLNEGCVHINFILGGHVVLNNQPEFDINAIQHTCASSHAMPCFKCSWVGKRCVFYCWSCYTDYSLGFVDLPGNGGRVCVLTTWKDLGSGECIKNREWQSHCCKGWSFRHFPDGCSPCVPEVYMAFEEETNWGFYNPSICQSRLADLAK
ncbi:hypothetical protein QBC46DRAFT_424063 [Diplogelasinospora grovesii]|uniref:Uncharacterized protein n=1 Tax=Diplogelasinospora grovesii TaxID=303347 RepID=A0AAN6S749_9PEZI|nr:hypothetical protein QBC46DRAFT_424063 [Diplogelasinospora grovesii]